MRGGKSSGLGGNRRQAMKLWRRSKIPLNRSLSILKIHMCRSQITLRIQIGSSAPKMVRADHSPR